MNTWMPGHCFLGQAVRGTQRACLELRQLTT